MRIETLQLGTVKLELLSSLRPVLTFSDFCSPAGTLEFTAHEDFLWNSVLLFRLSYNGFVFEARIQDGMVFIRRNGLYQHSEQYLGNEVCQVALQWTADSIGCGVVPLSSLTNMIHNLRAVRTPLTIPPNEMVNIFRRENLLFNTAYQSMDDFFSSLLDCLHCCQLDIRRHGAGTLFWRSIDGKRQPHNELEITKGIASFLSLYGVMKNFDVMCETLAGMGKLDFCLVAPVSSTQGLGKIAIEAKKADSSNLVQGLTTQLPDYMERIGTNYGIYLVYWLKCEDYAYPSQNSYAELEIEMLHPLQRSQTIRSIEMDLSVAQSPSKRRS